MRWIATGVVLALAAAPARAQPSNAQEKAKAHYLLGKAHQEAGEYDASIEEFQQAYQLAPAPRLFFNIAQSYRLKGDRAQAVVYYEKYLAAEPTGPGAAEARQHLAVLKEALAKEPTPPEEPAPASAPAPEPQPEPEQATGNRQQATGDRGGPEVAEGGRGGALRLAGIITGGVGVALLGGSFYFGLRARSLDHELSNGSGPWPTDLDDRLDEGKAAERNAILLGVVGGAAVATGTTLWLLGSRAQVTATAGRSGAAVSLWTSF